MSRSRYYPGPARHHEPWDERPARARATALRADLAEARLDFEHHARWSTSPEHATSLDYADPEAQVLLAASIPPYRHAHRSQRRREKLHAAWARRQDEKREAALRALGVRYRVGIATVRVFSNHRSYKDL